MAQAVPQVLAGVTISPLVVEPLGEPLPVRVKALGAQEQSERASYISRQIAGHLAHKLGRRRLPAGSVLSGTVTLPLSLPEGQSSVHELRRVERLISAQLILRQTNREPVTVEAVLTGRQIVWSHQRGLRLSFSKSQQWVLESLAEKTVDRALDRLFQAVNTP